MRLAELCETLERHKVPYAIIGGHAVALHGAPRGTVDFDFIIRWSKTALLKAEKAMHELGLVSRLPITAEELFHYRQEFIEKRNLIAWNFYHPKNPLIQVGLVVLWDLKGMKTKTFHIKNHQIKVLSKADLIKIKQQANRPQDIQDVQALESLK